MVTVMDPKQAQDAAHQVVDALASTLACPRQVVEATVLTLVPAAMCCWRTCLE